MNREQRKLDKQHEREQRKAERNTPERIEQRKQRWNKAKQWLGAGLSIVLRFVGFPLGKFSEGNLKNESNIYLTKNNSSMKSWKTTLGGVIGAVGVYLASNTDEPILHVIGQVLTAVGPLIIGITARDNNVSSETAGAK